MRKKTTKMKTVTKLSRQGSMLFRRVTDLPEGFVPVADKILEHSESGRHHVGVGDFTRYTSATDALRTFIVTKGSVDVVHEDTSSTAHKPFRLLSEGPAVWEIVHQREKRPEGWAKVID